MIEGSLEHHEDAWTLTFVRRLPHPPEKVWRAITEPEHLAAWFPTTIEGERAPGVPLRFAFPGGEVAPIDGLMIGCDPPRLLEFRWGGDETLRFELQPDGEGTRLTLINTIRDVGKAARDSAGWDVCLDTLAHHLDGTTPPWTPQERWREAHAGYLRRFPPEAATIGPPPSKADWAG